jgi:universal stress protein family protein
MLALIGAWTAVVVVTALVMARHGHAWFTWAVLATALGPLSWPLAYHAVTRRTPLDTPPADQLLIAVAPWVASPEPILTTLRTIEPHGRATIATVLEAEAAATAGGRAEVRGTEAELQRFADELVSSGLVQGPVTCRVLFGRAADELARLAQVGGYRAIVVGPSGSWMHHLLQGHTRARLERHTSVPVIFAAPPTEAS